MSNATPYRIKAAGHLLNTTSTVAPSLTDPTANTAFKNQMVTVGDDIYFVDATGNAVLVEKPLATSSVEPVVYQGSAFTSAQANDEANVAEALLLSDGTHIATGRIKYENHPYEIGNYYYLSQTVVGEVTKVQPTTGLVQPLFLVEDADHLLVKVDRATESVTSAYANIVYVNTADPNTATIFDDVNPPVANDDTLKSNSSNLYFGSDNSTWIWNGTAYATKPIVPTTEWFLSGTSTDAGSNKTNRIYRPGGIAVGADRLYGNVTSSGGTQFGPTTFPPYNTASLGYINYGSPWFGNGWLFSNTTTGVGAFSLVYNNDRAYFGHLRSSAPLSTAWGVWSGVGLNVGGVQDAVSDLETEGSLGVKFRVVTGNTTPTVDDTVLIMLTAASTVTLPAPTTARKRVHIIKNYADSSINITGLLDGTVSRTITLGSKQSLMVQSDNNTWNFLAMYGGEYRVSQQGSTGAILEGVSSYFQSDGNYTSPLSLPANAPYVGFDLMIINGATLNTTINTTNTDMAANFTLASGKAKVFKWGGSTAKWVALN